MKRLLLLLLLFAIPVQSATLHVPGNYPTIQSAINDALLFNDTVLVAPGRYYENIRFNGKNVVVASNYILSNDPQDILNTIIDGSQYTHIDSAATVVMLDHESFLAELVGFVITGGKGAVVFGPREGGGINIDNADPTIRNNVIVGNEAVMSPGNLKGGGGINFKNSNSKMIGNIVMWNKGYNYCGGVLIQNASVAMSNNLVAHNNGGNLTGTWDGAGGIYFYQMTSPCVLNNNIIADNFANKYGGIYALSGGNANLNNNIIRGNISGVVGTQIVLISTSTFNFPVSYSNVENGYTGTENIDDDPLWNNRYELLPTSTSIDTGNISFLFSDKEDSMNSGNAQPPAMGTTRNDLGVYGGPTPLPVLPIATYIHPILSFNIASTINYIEPDSLQPILIHIPVKNEGIAPGMIDSVSSGTEGTIINEFEMQLLWEDSIQVLLTPPAFDAYSDTIKIFHNDPNNASPYEIIFNYTPPNCCRNIRGNVDNDPSDIVDISDLVMLVDFLFTSGPAPECDVEGNIDGDIDGLIDISDLVMLVDFLFTSGPSPLPCS